MHCPSCGQPFEWEQRFSALAVCGACHSSVVLDKGALKVAGKMAVLAETPGPLYVGATGILKQRHYRILGRVRYGYEHGFWDEWYGLFEPDIPFWIGEDGAVFTLTRSKHIGIGDNFFEQASPGSRISLGDRSWIVREKNTANCEGGEGQLPFAVQPGEQIPFVELEGAGGIFATVEVEQNGARFFYGKRIEVGDIKVDIPKWDPSANEALGEQQVGRERVTLAPGEEKTLRCFGCGAPLESNAGSKAEIECGHCGAHNPTGGETLDCPSCDERLPLASGDKVQFCVCANCGAQISTQEAEPTLLGTAVAATRAELLIPLGAVGKLQGTRYVVTGNLGLSSMDEGYTYFTQEWLLYNEAKGYRWLSEENGHWGLGRPLYGEVPQLPVFRKSRTEVKGKSYKTFESGSETVATVYGQLPYVAMAGDKHSFVDAISPPFKVSQERTETESENYLVEYIPSREVQEAFDIDLSRMPSPRGVGACQPYPEKPSSKPLAILCLVFALLTTGASFWVESGRKLAQFDLSRLEKEELVETTEFSLKGGLVAFDFSADLSTGFALADVTIKDAAGKTAGFVSAKLENRLLRSRDSTRTWVRVPKGKYLLSIRSKANPTATFFQLSVKDRTGLSAMLDLLSFIFFAIPLFQFGARRIFESRRWSSEGTDVGPIIPLGFLLLFLLIMKSGCL